MALHLQNLMQVIDVYLCLPQDDTTLQGTLGVSLKRKDSMNKMAFGTQGCTQGDRPIQSPELSNRHMSFS